MRFLNSVLYLVAVAGVSMFLIYGFETYTKRAQEVEIARVECVTMAINRCSNFKDVNPREYCLFVSEALCSKEGGYDEGQ